MRRLCLGCDEEYTTESVVLSGPGIEPRIIGCSAICVLVGMLQRGLVELFDCNL